MNTPNPLAEAPIRPLFFKYYLPTLTSVLSLTVHQIVNGIILGRQVGKEGIAAVGLYGSVLLVFIALTLPVMIGGGILIGKNIGAGDYAKARQIFRFATTIGLIFGGVIVLCTPFIVDPIAGFLAGNKSELLVKSAADYMFWQFLGLPFFFLRMFWGNFISNDGAPKEARNASLIAVLLNIVLDILLIIVFKLGVNGASIATSCSILTGTLFLFLHIRKGKGHLSFEGFHFTLKLKEWRELLSLGLPSFASEIAFSTGLLVINRSVVSYGPLVVAAFGMINYLSFIFLRLFTAAMIASLTITSFNIGAGLPKRVLGTLRFALGFTFVLGLIVTGIGLLIPDWLLAPFRGEETDAYRQQANHALQLYFLLFLAAGPNFILAAYFQSTGKWVISILVNILKGGVMIALFAFLLPDWFGVDGVWLARGLGEIATLILVGVFSLLNWKKYYVESAVIKK